MIKKRMRAEIESVMKGPARRPFFSLATLLLPISKGYASTVCVRNRSYHNGRLRSSRLPCMVISIGNIAAGGTGKTPFTMFLGKFLQESGIRTTIISRGYGGKAEKTGGVVSDGHQVIMDSKNAGDEPYMLAMKLPGIPVVVGKNRHLSGKLAFRRFHPQVILLDDGFQHLALRRDLDIVLLDHSAPMGNGHVIPRGILREPPKGLQRADILVMTRSSDKHSKEILPGPAVTAGPQPVFFTDYKADIFVSGGPADIYRKPASATNTEMGEKELHGKRVFAFAGIADNASFNDTVKNLGCFVQGCMWFPDHHPYTRKDLEHIYRRFEASGADILITTEKDYVKFYSDVAWEKQLYVVGVRVRFLSNKARFEKVLCRYIHKAVSSVEKYQIRRQER